MTRARDHAAEQLDALAGLVSARRDLGMISARLRSDASSSTTRARPIETAEDWRTVADIASLVAGELLSISDSARIVAREIERASS